ncbi:MAG: hypothetical protein M3Z05_23290, partial [Gemmatimonadota bacterium]|nr:hypothetical protein [Gemmatimonadota bacterium]
ALLACALSVQASIAQNATAPTGPCKFEIDPSPTTRAETNQLPSGQYNSYLGGGVTARCRAQNIVLKSDSLELYGDEGRFYFIGHVDYREPRLKLKSQFLTYFQRDERILAVSSVDAQLPSGSTLKGPSLEFFRPIPKVRPKQQGVAIGRPTMTIIDKDAQGKPQPPVKLTGNTIWLNGDSIVASSGDVIIVRPELTATGDSLYLDGGPGLLRLMRNPKVVGTKGRPFTLTGETIDLLTRRKKLERVLAKNKGFAVSEDLELKSDTIDLRVTDDLLQRAIIWGRTRAFATSPSQTISADSIDVIMPGQRIREMHAVRGASAFGVPDTTKFHLSADDRYDRLTGDTIVAQFDSVPARDTVTKPRIRELVAINNATSYQHLAPQDTSLRLPAINYVCGKRITVTFDSAKVRRVKVEDSDPPCGGALAEPASDTSRKRAAPPPPAAATLAPSKPGSTPSSAAPTSLPAGVRKPE